MVATLGAIGAGYAAAAITPTNEPSMNCACLLSPTPWPPTLKWSTSFKDYPRRRRVLHGVRWAHHLQCSEVFWTALPEVNLPDDIVKRFKGKGMAVVGFEADQVRQGAGPNGEDVSVPISASYNHHFGVTIAAKLPSRSVQWAPSGRSPSDPTVRRSSASWG